MTTNACAVFDFRANKDVYKDAEELSGHLHKYAKKFVFQLEKGDSGYEHWQGRMSLWKKRRGNEIKARMTAGGMPLPNYLAPTTTTEHLKEGFYMMKEDTRIQGPWSDKDSVAYVPIQYRNIELWDYQATIVESRSQLDFRKVDCIIDDSGNNGKSTVAALADLKHKCIDMPTFNDGEKLIQSLCDILMAKDIRQPGIIFFDMPRAQGKEKLSGLYTAIEQIKKGKVWDTRNSYKEWWFDSPRIWVFTNTKPDVKCLSADRWRFWMIKDKKLAPYEEPCLIQEEAPAE